MTATIGQTIKKLRKKNGWTQEELAAKLNISAQAVSKWETEVSRSKGLLHRIHAYRT